MKTTLRTLGFALAFSFVAATGGHAMFMPPQMVPVERLLKSAEAYATKNPKDAEAHYLLARVHYLAFVTKRENIPGFPMLTQKGEGGKPEVVAPWMQGWNAQGDKGAALTAAAMVDHATKAHSEFKKAMELAPKKGLYVLGLASLIEEVKTWSDKAKPEGLPPELQKITIEHLRKTYGEAFTVGMPEDSKLKMRPLSGLEEIVSYEAAKALVRLGKEQPATLTEADKAEIKKAEEALAKFDKLPMGAVTPIVFSFQPAAHLDQMLDKERTVDFDLRGYGRRDEQWTWVKPELGLLVWDPLETGEVKSAHQLFGNYTFQIFRKTGYDAMAALDDNADGALAGAELNGMSVWFDRNGDGRSTAAEVTPLRELGVEALSVTATTQDGVHPMNLRGLTMKDGRVLPTWDWMVEPVRTR
jgi:hypothetical protein